MQMKILLAAIANHKVATAIAKAAFILWVLWLETSIDATQQISAPHVLCLRSLSQSSDVIPFLIEVEANQMVNCGQWHNKWEVCSEHEPGC